MSRMLLTTVEYDGELWNVHLATVRDAPAMARIQLEFEPTEVGGARPRYTRAVGGPLLRALESGEGFSLEAIRDELVQAVGEPKPRMS